MFAHPRPLLPRRQAEHTDLPLVVFRPRLGTQPADSPVDLGLADGHLAAPGGFKQDLMVDGLGEGWLFELTPTAAGWDIDVLATWIA